MKPTQKKIVFQVQFDDSSSPYSNRHNLNIYLQKYLDFRQSMIQNLEQFVPIDIIPKNPPKFYNHLTSKKGNNLYHDLKHNKLVHFPRRDSFEVSVDNFVIFSRLQMGGWPDTNALTEWTLRVYQKIADEETIKQTKQPKESINKKNNETDKNKSKGQILHRSLQIQNEDEPYLHPITFEQKLPPISQTGQQLHRGSIASNYTTLPVREDKKNSRYYQDRSEDDQLPRKLKGDNLIDFQATKYVSRRNNKFLGNRKRKIQEFKDTVYYADSKPRSKNHSFHWNIGVPRSLSKGKTTIKVNEENPKKDIYRQKNVQLTPLPHDIRVERDRLLSQKLKPKKPEERIQKVEINLSESSLNCYSPLYDIKENKIKKVSSDNSWSPLICQNPLPLSGLYYFSFAVLRSVNNMIQVGIAPLCYYPKSDQPEADFQLISYNCNNGMIKDSKLDQLANKTTWRLGGEPAPKDQPFQMRVAIDTQNFFIDWYVDDAIVASSKMPKIYHQGFRVIINLYNTEDSVLINEEDWKDRIRFGKFDKGSVLLEKKASQYSQRSHNSQLSHHSNHSQFGKIKKILSNSPRKEDSPKTPVASQKIVESFVDNYSPLSMDQEIQTDFVGRIRRQRLLKYKEKKGKVDQGIITDNLLKQKDDQSPLKEEDKIDISGLKEIKANQKEEKDKERSNPIQDSSKKEKEKINSNQLEWVGLYSDKEGFSLIDPSEAQKKLKQIEEKEKKVQAQYPINNVIEIKQKDNVPEKEQNNENIINKDEKKDTPSKKQEIQPQPSDFNQHENHTKQPQSSIVPASSQPIYLVATQEQTTNHIAEKQQNLPPSNQPLSDVTENQKKSLSNDKISASKALNQSKEQVSKEFEWKAFYQDSIYRLQSIKT